MKGKTIIISGFSGSGKGTIVKKLLNENNNYEISISCTTRKKRDSEIDGKSYFFISKEKFEDMINKDLFLEYAHYVDNYYGTPKEYVISELEKGKNVILEIEVQGALKVKQQYKDALLIFILPPSAKILYDRMKHRNTETEEQIKNRLKRSLDEIEYIDNYDKVLVNDDLSICVENIKKIEEDKNIVDDNDKEIKYIIKKYIEDIKGEKYV